MVLVCLLLSLGACQNTKTEKQFSKGDTVALKYAKLLTIIDYNSFKQVVIKNPWKQNSVLHQYILVDKNHKTPENLPEGTVVRTPVNRAVVYSSVHFSLLELLQKETAVEGICDSKFAVNPKLKKLISQKRIYDYGNSMNPNIEQIIERQPEILMPSPFEQSGSYGKLGKLGIPIVECADYMELSALGRAEWMKFYGILFGVEQKADSLFQVTEKEYNHIKELASKQKNKPSLLSEMKTGANWFVPGGNSTSGQLYQDAGARYVFAHLKHNGAIPFPFEKVLEQAENTDIWIIKYNQKETLSYKQLQMDYKPYTRFKAWKNKHIYGCNTQYIPFYEETPFQPQLLLKDLAGILHPSIFPKDRCHYFTPIKP